MNHARGLTFHPLANRQAVISGDTWRFTVLSETLIRVEYSAMGHFNDFPTQTVLCRDFPLCDFDVHRDGDTLTVETAKLLLTYTGGAFTSRSLSILVKQSPANEDSVWHFGAQSRYTRGGTARTLDGVDGACPVGHGLFSFDGWEVLDDSHTLLLTEDGWIQPRQEDAIDQYVFGCNRDYLQGLRDFYRLTGDTPMLPRYALGNWWSRYYEYTQESYLKLMENFRRENVPFSVAVIDMDWHITKVEPKYGIGWTGFTWNSELFPDHRAFLKALHDQGMKVTLNLHPADGIRAYEACYPAVAAKMGVDAAQGQKVAFDVTNRKFLQCYFEDVLHPMEAEGVDFWWVDWQQGTNTAVAGLDPLWMLNHYHFLDSGRDGKRPMTFSRYAGAGSHRYPVGFSGDTVVSWESLDFQPYFTLTADNIGYGWWSHDIGGHMHGIKDDELYGRWLQFGVFSPICRLHSTKNDFNGREPWRFRNDVRQMVGTFLRLRHQLIPYLYTMNYRAWAQCVPLCLPMYYLAPDCKAAYNVPNEYTFGTALLCAPITRPAEPHRPAKVTVWLPEGAWYDFFTGLRYDGGRTMTMYRYLDCFPVLAKAGAIIPMTDAAAFEDVSKNPATLTVRVYPGADGDFTLYEDASVTDAYLDGECVTTAMHFRYTDQPSMTVAPAEGKVTLLPASRTWRFELPGVRNTRALRMEDGVEIPLTTAYDETTSTLTVEAGTLPIGQAIVITFPDGLKEDDTLLLRRLYAFLDRAEMPYDLKQSVYNTFADAKNSSFAISQLQALVSDATLLGALTEFAAAHPW